MCVPCVAATPGLLEILFGILVVVGAVLAALARFIPTVAAVLALIGVGVYRFATGAVLRKPLRTSDDTYWARERRQKRRGPRVTRGVRATGRLLVVGAGLGLVINPVGVSVLIGTLIAGTGGIAAYTRLSRPLPAPQLEPVRVKAVIGRG